MNIIEYNEMMKYDKILEYERNIIKELQCYNAIQIILEVKKILNS